MTDNVLHLLTQLRELEAMGQMVNIQLGTDGVLRTVRRNWEYHSAQMPLLNRVTNLKSPVQWTPLIWAGLRPKSAQFSEVSLFRAWGVLVEVLLLISKLLRAF